MTKKAKLPKVASAWDLFRSSLTDFRANWKPYTKILAVIAIPTNAIGLFALAGADDIAASYISFASIVMNVAFIWALVQKEKTGTVPKVSTAYYEGSIALVRFLLVSFALVLFIIPAAFGAALYVVSLQVAEYTGVYGAEQILVGFVAILLALPSAYLLTRYGLAPFAAVRDELRPVAALKRARRYTLGRFWAVAGRFTMLGIFLIVLGLPPLLIYFGLSFLNIGNAAQVLFNILSTLIVLPIANLFLYRLYHALDHAHNS